MSWGICHCKVNVFKFRAMLFWWNSCFDIEISSYVSVLLVEKWLSEMFFEYMLCLLLISVGNLCINAIQVDHDQEFFFFWPDWSLVWHWYGELSLYLVCTLLHIFLYACKMCFPFEQIVHNRIRGGLKAKRKSEAIWEIWSMPLR